MQFSGTCWEHGVVGLSHWPALAAKIVEQRVEDIAGL